MLVQFVYLFRDQLYVLSSVVLLFPISLLSAPVFVSFLLLAPGSVYTSFFLPLKMYIWVTDLRPFFFFNVVFVAIHLPLSTALPASHKISLDESQQILVPV